MPTISSLTPEQLYRRCNPSQFAFTTTAELEDLAEIIGQTRALDAIRFGSDIQREGYNLFVIGPDRQGGRRSKYQSKRMHHRLAQAAPRVDEGSAGQQSGKKIRERTASMRFPG